MIRSSQPAPPRPTEPPTSRQRALQQTLQELGLAGRVQVGAGGAALLTPSALTPPGRAAAGASRLSIDDLLRPLERPAAARVIEIGGARSSGRTALACRISAGATARGELVGWVDPADALDPRSLARAGADLSRLLWVRPRGARKTFRAAELLLEAGFAVVVIDLGDPRDLGGVEVRALQRLGTAAWSRLQRSARSRAATVLILSSAEHDAVLPQAGPGASRSGASGSGAFASGGPGGSGGWAGAFATLGIATQRRHARFEWGLFEGFDARARIVRQRAGPSGDTLAFHLLHLPESARTEVS